MNMLLLAALIVVVYWIVGMIWVARQKDWG